MKHLLSLYFFCLLVKLASGQNTIQEKEFINQVIPSHNITYVDVASKQGAAMLRKVLKLNKKVVVYKLREDSVIFVDSTGARTRMLRSKAEPIILKEMSGGRFTQSRLISVAADSLILSDSEIDHTLRQFEKISNVKWDKSLIKGADQIAEDTINNLFKNPQADGWAYVRKKGINSYLSFSTPVFIRNDTYCIFYSDERCGQRCGEGKLEVYKNEKGKWTYWAIISSWII